MTQDPDSRSPSQRPAQALGFLLGIALGLGLFILAAPSNSPWVVGALLLVLVIASTVVLRRPRLRTAGAGVLAGMAVGAIVFAGACGGLLGMIFASLAGR